MERALFFTCLFVAVAMEVALFGPRACADDKLLNETVEFTGTVLFLQSHVPALVIGVVRDADTGNWRLRCNQQVRLRGRWGDGEGGQSHDWRASAALMDGAGKLLHVVRWHESWCFFDKSYGRCLTGAYFRVCPSR